jgi:hypothetical protein
LKQNFWRTINVEVQGKHSKREQGCAYPQTSGSTSREEERKTECTTGWTKPISLSLLRVKSSFTVDSILDATTKIEINSNLHGFSLKHSSFILLRLQLFLYITQF